MLSCHHQTVSEIQVDKSDKPSLIRMFWNLLVCTFQTVFGYVCLDVCVSVTLHYINKGMTSIDVAGYGFALNCVYIIVLPIGFGFNQSLNMHTAQAIGDGKHQLAQRFFNVNLYVMLMFLIPFSGILIAIKKPFSLIVEESRREEIADCAWQYLWFLIPAIILAIIFESIKIFMASYKITYPFAIIHFITLLLHWLFSWLFIMKFEWGIPGAGFAIILTEIFNMIGIILFIQFTEYKKKIFQGIKILPDIPRIKKLGLQYCKTSMPILVHIYCAYFIFVLLTFVALSLNTPSVNAHLALQTVSGTFFRLPISLSIAIMSYVGTEMGYGNIIGAKQYVIVGILIFLITCSLCASLLWVFQDEFIDFFTTESDQDEFADETKNVMRETLPWMIAGSLIIDGMQGTLSGALKGINKANLVQYSTLFAYFVCCVPIVSFFAYDWGLGNGTKGIWQGFGISNLILSTLFTLSLIFTDWKKESDLIINRIKKENELQKSTLHQIEEQMLYD
ncbi:unnamed protein product [Paramecium sonneborni]|uniref:Multidrug and toxin extrusion protein n=1 Tax=Paramecium sonneborni TaxID=65129 RepID=A0A8S1P8U2_9CILI|nr:unnamed protein product [Paramecium sonneborni]